MTSALKIVFDDIHDGIYRLDLAVALAVEDLKDRYRRSCIGLAWIVLSFAAFISVKGLIFFELFSRKGYDYFSHLTIGFALFGFISAVVSGGANLFIINRTWILSSNLSYTVYVHNLIIRHLVELVLIGLATAVLILLLGDVNPGFLWTLPFAIGLYYVTSFAISLVLAPIGVKFRDFVYAIQTAMRILFFATPILWVSMPGTLREVFALWNPLTYYLDIIRVPIIEGHLPLSSWVICIAITASLSIVGTMIFGRTKRKIPLWI